MNSPIGAMGMNSGIHDAFNLAEKLVRILRGEAGDDVLDRYERQRRHVASAGNPAVFVAVRDKDAVDRAGLDLAGARDLGGEDGEPACVFVFTPTPEGAYSRMFAPEFGVAEDPATGSMTGPLAAFMMRHRLVSSASGTRVLSEQGVKMRRRSILHVQVRGEGGADGIDVGGYVTPLVEATMRF